MVRIPLPNAATNNRSSALFGNLTDNLLMLSLQCRIGYLKTIKDILRQKFGYVRKG